LRTSFCPPFTDRFGWPAFGLNDTVNCTEVAKAVYRKARGRYTVVILQMLQWWKRVLGDPAGTRIETHHRNLVKLIEAFASPIPDLPELRPPEGVPQDLDSNEQWIEPPGHGTASPSLSHDAEGSLSGAAYPEGGEHNVPSSSGPSEKDETQTQRALELSIQAATEEEQAHVAEAVLRSKSDALPLNGDGVVILRLTRRSTHIESVLRESPALAACRARVRDAECELFPQWANGACLLVPLTEAQVAEAGLELHAHNIIAHAGDQADITSALAEICNRQRPKVRPEHQATNQQSATEYHTNASGLQCSQGMEPVSEQGGEIEEFEDTAGVDFVVERTFISVRQTELSEASAMASSAPCGVAGSPQPENPRRWNKSRTVQPTSSAS